MTRSDAHCPLSLSILLCLSFPLFLFYPPLLRFSLSCSILSFLFLSIIIFSLSLTFSSFSCLLYTFFFLSNFFFFSVFHLPPYSFVPRSFFPLSLCTFSSCLFLSLFSSLFMGSIRTGSLTVQDGMKRFGMGWSGAGSNSWTNEPTDRTAGACSQIDARGSSWAPLFVYLLHPLYSLLTLLILVHSPL